MGSAALALIAKIVIPLIVAGLGTYDVINTNKQNKKINEENREFQRKQQEDAQEFARLQQEDAQAFDSEQLDKQNQFSIDYAQRLANMEQAGLNPVAFSMASGQMFGTNTPSAIGSPAATASPPSTPGGIPIQPVTSQIANAIESITKGFVNVSESQDRDVFRDLDYKSRQQNISNMVATFDGFQLDNKYKQIVNNFLPYMQISDIQLKQAENQLTYAEKANTEKATDILRYQLENTLPQELINLADQHQINVMQVERMSSEIELLGKDIELAQLEIWANEQQLQIEQNDAYESNLRTAWIISHTEEYLNAINSSMIQTVNQSNLSKKEVRWFWAKTLGGAVRDIGVGVGSSLGGVGNAIGGVVRGVTGLKK